LQSPIVDAPDIEQEQTYIKTEAGEEIHVTCFVHAYPEPQVEWEKDGQPIDEHTNGFVINKSGDRHNLILLVVKKEFFGDYSCRARNELGVATKSAHVSGRNLDVCLCKLIEVYCHQFKKYVAKGEKNVIYL
jgi:hypothetical protein